MYQHANSNLKAVIADLKKTEKILKMKIKNLQIMALNLKESFWGLKTRSTQVCEALVRLVAVGDTFSSLKLFPRLEDLVSVLRGFDGVIGCGVACLAVFLRF